MSHQHTPYNKNDNNNILDQFLLCDEVWDMSPASSSHSPHDNYSLRNRDYIDNSVHLVTKHDIKHSFDTCVQKEVKYMVGLEYINLLRSNGFVKDCRLKAIHWFIHCQRRFNLCIGTLFKAVNHVDRFIDMNKCHGWSYWMMELLSLVALSIAVKFGETCPPSLREIQKEGLEYSFDAKLVQKMEMKMLKSLGWEVNAITPCSYVELIEWELKQHFKPIDRSTLDEILLAFTLDAKLLEYRPCVIAVSALRCILEDEICLSHITNFIPIDQKKKIQSCYNKMQEILVEYQKHESNRNPSSPDTVLIKELKTPISMEQIDLSFMDGPTMKEKLKRKRDVQHDDDCVIMNKKHVNK